MATKKTFSVIISNNSIPQTIDNVTEIRVNVEPDSDVINPNPGGGLAIQANYQDSYARISGAVGFALPNEKFLKALILYEPAIVSVQGNAGNDSTSETTLLGTESKWLSELSGTKAERVEKYTAQIAEYKTLLADENVSSVIRETKFRETNRIGAELLAFSYEEMLNPHFMA